MASQWLLFLPHLPSPSSLRAFVWLTARGAQGCNSFDSARIDRNTSFMNELLAEAQPQGGQGFIFFRLPPQDESARLEIIERFSE